MERATCTRVSALRSAFRNPYSRPTPTRTPEAEGRARDRASFTPAETGTRPGARSSGAAKAAGKVDWRGNSFLLFAEPGAGVSTAEPKTTTMRCTLKRGRGIDFTRRMSGGVRAGVGRVQVLGSPGLARYSAPNSRMRICIVGDQRAMRVTSMRDGADWSTNVATSGHGCLPV